MGIAAGPDGNMWFTESEPAEIGRITTNGAITKYPVPNTGTNTPWAIAAGPDGNLWFTDYGGGVGNIGRITTSGAITEYATPTALSGPWAIAAGPDGNMWFTELIANKIAKAILK
jgi:virginiamycin B lyase